MRPEEPAVGVSSRVSTSLNAPMSTDRQPVVGLGDGGDMDHEGAIRLAQHRPGIARAGQGRIDHHGLIVGAGRIECPEAGRRGDADYIVGAAGGELLAGAVGGSGERQAFGAAIKQLACARPVRLGIGVGILRLGIRKGDPRTKRDRPETDGRLQGRNGRDDADAEGNGQSKGDEERDAEQEALPGIWGIDGASDVSSSRRHTPLCHFGTSPPQGGRSGARRCCTSARSYRCCTIAIAAGLAKLSRPISPLEGEMSRSDRGG